jgi:hypothetical protein
VYEAEKVATLARLTGDVELTNRANNWAADNGATQAHTAEAKQAAYEHLKARGILDKLPDNLSRATLSNLYSEAEQLQKPDDNPDYLAARKRHDDVKARLSALANAATDMSLSEAERTAAWELRTRLLAESHPTTLWNEEVVPAWRKAVADRAAAHADLLRGAGEQIVAKALEASSVTAEDALAWAKAQYIEPAAVAKLKRQKYSLEQFQQDMADYYRLAGGKASTIKFLAGGKRANAGGITTVNGEKYINLDTSFSKVTLWHELAHHLENDPLAQAAAQGFLLARRESDKLYRLRDLTGSDFYAPKEVAWKDSFTDPYVGRVYPHGTTEVFSMGLQYLSDPVKAAWFAGKDPEMFDLVTGYLQTPTSPAMRAKLDMHKDAIGEKADEAAAKEAEYRAALAWLADRVTITHDNWFNEVDRSTYAFDLFKSYTLNKEKTRAPAYVGSSGEFKVFSGAYAKLGTRRYSKGWQVVQYDPQSDRIPDSTVVHGDMETVRAVIAIAKINGTGPGAAYTLYFFNYRGKDMLIQLVKGLQ